MKQKLETVNNEIEAMEEQVHDLAHTGEHQYKMAEVACGIVGLVVGIVVGILVCQL